MVENYRQGDSEDIRVK